MSPQRPPRRALLAGAGLLGSAGCSGGDGSPEPTATPSTGTSSPTASPSPTAASSVPPNTSADQRSEYRYGEHPRQVSDLWLPTGERRDGLVVLVHGGGYGAQTDRRDLNDLVSDLVERGWPVLNTDYRGVGDGGGWTSTFTDVSTAVDMAAEAASAEGLPVDRVVVVGHSAGGHLALWAAARRALPAGAPGAGPRVQPLAAASMSGVLHPTALGGPGGDPNVAAVLGGAPAAVDDHYAIGDPTRLVPLGMPLYVLHGTADETVPPSQAQEFHDAAVAAGDDVVLDLAPGAGHADPLHPWEPEWPRVRDWIEARLA